jgi:glycosyltransferase involved in cell wall biosynthesis
LPYTHVFQSGVLFLGYSFGLPVIAADVGALKEEIVEGETGFVFERENPGDLARAIRIYFASGLYRDLDIKRQMIYDYANGRYSWTKVGEITRRVYSDLLAT